MMAHTVLMLIAVLVLGLPSTAQAGEERGILLSPPGADLHALLVPEGSLFPLPIADPHGVGFGVQTMHLSRTSIVHSGDQRFNLQAGGRFGIVRIHQPDDPGLGWQFGIEGGFDGQFDMDHSLDNIGWDGNYGLLVEYAPLHSLAFRIAALHTSSHVGDEYAERIGRLRIGYTRNEFAAGLSWRPADKWRWYAEAAHAYDLRNDLLQQPGRLQAGLEYEHPRAFWGNRMGWYAALDLQAWEERDWRRDRAFQAGILFRTRGRDWRFGFEHADGRSTMGEFFQDTERWTAFGAWVRI